MADGTAIAMLRVLGCIPMRRLSGLWVLFSPQDPTECLAFDDKIFMMHVCESGSMYSTYFSVGSYVHSGACSSTFPTTFRASTLGPDHHL